MISQKQVTEDENTSLEKMFVELSGENKRTTELPVGLMQSHRIWSFGLCFLYLCNIKKHRWNYKRVYLIYIELALKLRIEPSKRFRRERSDALARSTSLKPGVVDGLHGRQLRRWATIQAIERVG